MLPVEIELLVEISRLPPDYAVFAGLREECLSEELDAVHVVPVDASCSEVSEVDMNCWE